MTGTKYFTSFLPILRTLNLYCKLQFSQRAEMNWPVTWQCCIIFLPLRDSVCLLDLLNSTLHDGQLVQFLNLAIWSSFSGVIGMSLDNMLLIRTCSRLR